MMFIVAILPLALAQEGSVAGTANIGLIKSNLSGAWILMQPRRLQIAIMFVPE
jgi:hypothetical protein